MAEIQCFAPVAEVDARLLILGSMPGEASLHAGKYYAHERNAFWRIMGDLLGAGPELPYEQRLERLKAAGIALWDVMAACERRGSLDADIRSASVQVNDFPNFLAAHPAISRIYFNGAAAETAFRRHQPALAEDASLRLLRLPSTSPAYAARRYDEKLAAWSVIITASNM